MTPASAGLDPLSLVVNTEYGGAMHYARRYDEAIQILRKTLDMDRSFSFASWYFAQALERIGRCDEAIAELERVGAAGGIYILMELASAHAVAGRPKEARRILAEQLTKREFIDPGLVAMVHADLQDRDEAFRWLEKSYQERSPEVVFLKVEPKFDPLRSDPRFTSLLRRVKLV
jgi:tetratricopeptide (TPR) repeat protein